VTTELIEEFEQQYQIYQHETIEQRRDRLNQERIDK